MGYPLRMPTCPSNAQYTCPIIQTLQKLRGHLTTETSPQIFEGGASNGFLACTGYLLSIPMGITAPTSREVGNIVSTGISGPLLEYAGYISFDVDNKEKS